MVCEIEEVLKKCNDEMRNIVWKETEKYSESVRDEVRETLEKILNQIYEGQLNRLKVEL